MYQLFRSLAYIHSLGICHRDIKPQNLLLDPATGVLKLCDFGSAKHLVRGEPNVSYICSRYYRAPELIFGAIDYTTKIGMYFLLITVSFWDMIMAGLCRTNPNCTGRRLECGLRLGWTSPRTTHLPWWLGCGPTRGDYQGPWHAPSRANTRNESQLHRVPFPADYCSPMDKGKSKSTDLLIFSRFQYFCRYCIVEPFVDVSWFTPQNSEWWLSKHNLNLNSDWRIIAKVTVHDLRHEWECPER